jgi:hypothetical protein
MAPALLPLALSAALSWLDPATVQPGQKGICVTEWTGGERREIPVVVMGVLDASGPDRKGVLVRLEDERLAGTGVVAGMSGSPVYLDGKLLGALALGWAWAREPLGIVTPFATMHDISLAGPAATTQGPTLAQLASIAAGTTDPWALLPQLPSRRDLPPQLLAVSGLSVPTGFAADLLTRIGLQPVPAGTAHDLAGVPAPGDMMAVQLVWGDASLAAGGTVTASEGDLVWAFGHPLYGLGEVKLPVARARVLAIQGSYQSPFKVFAVGEPFGTLVADRSAGVVAKVGAAPDGTSMTVRVRDVIGDKTWRFAIAEMPILQPLLVTFLTNACLTARGASAGEASVRLALTIHTGDGREIAVHQALRGPDALARLSLFAGTVVSFLANSPFPHPALSGVELILDRDEEPRGASILEAVPARTTVRPGDELTVDVRLQQQERPVEHRLVTIRVPAGASAGPLELIVADGESWSDYRLRAEAIVPADYSDQIDQLRRLGSSTDLVAALEARERGAALPGVSQPGLPPSWSITLASGLGSRALTHLATVVLATERVAGSYPLEGSVRVQLTVRPGPEVP